MRLIANYQGYTNTAEHNFQATLVDPCAAVSLTIDPSISNLLNINYNIGEGPLSIQFQNSLVTASPPLTTCPDIIFSIDDGNGGAIDSSVFHYQANTSCSKEYHLRTENKSWSDARAACLAEGMDLASITSAAENA